MLFTSLPYSKRILRPHAFTIIELLVVITIITILVTMLLPSLSTARTLAKNLACLSNIRGVASCSASYASDYKEYPLLIPTADTGWADYGQAGTQVSLLVNNGYMTSINQSMCPQSYRSQGTWYYGWWCGYGGSGTITSTNTYYDFQSGTQLNPGYVSFPYIYLGPVIANNPATGLPWVWIDPRYQPTLFGGQCYLSSPTLVALQADRGKQDPSNGYYYFPNYKKNVEGLLATCAAAQSVPNYVWGAAVSHGVTTIDASGNYTNKECRSYVFTDGAGGTINK